YFVRITGQAGVDYSLVVTRDAEFDTEPNGDLAHSQDITGTIGALGHVAGGGSTVGAHVLYFTDGGPITSDPYLVALANLGITPTVVAGSTADPTAPYANFVTQLQVGGWDLVIFQQRFWASGDFPSFSWTTPFLSYISGGGHVIYSTWMRTQVFGQPQVAALYAALGATSTGGDNHPLGSPGGASPRSAGIPRPPH